MVDIVEILIHWYAGRSQHELSASLGVDRKTARKYVAPAVAAGLEPGGPPMAEADWRRLVVEWFPELSDARLRQVSWPVIEAHRDYIAGQLAAGVTVATVHRRLAAERGLTASVASVRRWVRANLPEDARRAQVTVLRDTPPPGQEALCGLPHNASYEARGNMRRGCRFGAGSGSAAGRTPAAEPHTHRLSRNSRIGSGGRYRPVGVLGGVVLARACSLRLRSAWR